MTVGTIRTKSHRPKPTSIANFLATVNSKPTSRLVITLEYHQPYDIHWLTIRPNANLINSLQSVGCES